MKRQGKLISISFSKVCWCCLPKIVKISQCLSKLQHAKVGTFFWDSTCVQAVTA